MNLIIFITFIIQYLHPYQGADFGIGEDLYKTLW